MATLNNSKKAPAGKTARGAMVSTATKTKAVEVNLTEEHCGSLSILTSGYMDDEEDIVIVPLVKPIKAARRIYDG